MKNIKKCIYEDAVLYKLENKRVQVVSLPSGDYAVELKIRSDDPTPRALHEVTRKKIVYTGLKLSKEAALFLMLALQERLKEDVTLGEREFMDKIGFNSYTR